MAAKIILVTHAPTKGGQPLDGASGRRLAALAGIDQADLVQRFEVRSVLDAPWGPMPLETRGTTKEADAARLAETRRRIALEQASGDVIRSGLAGRKIVLLGREVAVAFRLRKGEQFDWFDPIEIEPGIEAAVIPHPGGVAGWWNDEGNQARAREFILALKLGFLGQPKRRGKDRFSIAQVAAALEAGRGIYTWAATAIRKATGLSCDSQTIKTYVDRYPDELGPIFERQRVSLAGMVVHGLVTKAEAGETSVLRELAGMRFIQDIAREKLNVDLRKTIGVEHSGKTEHVETVRYEVTLRLEEARNQLADQVAAEVKAIAQRNADDTTKH